MEPEKKHGALIGSIIVIVILIIGGIYMWQTKIKAIQEENKKMEELKQTEQNNQELDSIDQELNNTNTDLDPSALKTLE